MFNRKKKTPWGKILAGAAAAKAMPKRPLFGSLGGLAAMVGGIFAYKKIRQKRAASAV